MMKIIIDGAYYKNVLKFSFSAPKIDILKVVDTMKDVPTAYSVKYYSPIRRPTNFDGDFERTRARNLEDYLHTLGVRGIEVARTTELAGRGEGGRDWPDLYTQMCVDITRLVFAGRIDTLVVMAENRSLVPAMVVARAEGVRVELWHGPNRTADLQELTLHADKTFPITVDLIQAWRLAA